MEKALYSIKNITGRKIPIAKVSARGAAIAPYFQLQQPSCGPGSNPKHVIYDFFNFNCNCYGMRKRLKTNDKEAGIGRLKK